MDAQLHKWWREGFFAFDPLSIDHDFIFKDDTKTYTRIKLQFHWMPRRKDPDAKAPPLKISKLSQSREALSAMLGKTYGDLDPNNPIFAEDRQVSVCHHLRTGDIFYVKVEHRLADRMLTPFKLQWAVIKIYAVAGGVESLRDVGEHLAFLGPDLEWPAFPMPSMQQIVDDYLT